MVVLPCTGESALPRWFEFTLILVTREAIGERMDWAMLDTSELISRGAVVRSGVTEATGDKHQVSNRHNLVVQERTRACVYGGSGNPARWAPM